MATVKQMAKVEETNRVAHQIILSEVEDRRRKMERLREARLAADKA